MSAVLFEAPCIAVTKPGTPLAVDAEKCISCRRCIKELGCPAVVLDHENGKVKIERDMCTGCSACAEVCPVGAIGEEK